MRSARSKLVCIDTVLDPVLGSPIEDTSKDFFSDAKLQINEKNTHGFTQCGHISLL